MRKWGNLVVVFLVAGCTTVSQPIETPSGTTETVDGEMSILRVVRKVVHTGTQVDARSGRITERVEMSCPAGTRMVLPVPEQVVFGFGEVEESEDATGSRGLVWTQPRQRPLGVSYSGVTVERVYAAEAGEQRVELAARFWLTDKNGDDPWWQAQAFHVLCLGNHSLE